MITKESITNVSGDTPVLGYLLYYRTGAFSIPYSHFTDLLDQCGIDKAISHETRAKSAFLRAVKDNKTHDSVVRHIEGEKETITVVAKVDANTSYEATISSEAVPVFDKENKSIKQTGGLTGLQTSFDHHKTMYSADQFRFTAIRYLKQVCSALTVTNTGGMYFVSIKFKNELDKLEKLFNLIGHDCTLFPIPVYDNEQTRKPMWVTMTNEVAQDIVKLKEEFDTLDTEISERTLAIRLKRYATVKSKVEMYEEALQGTADTLKSELDNLSKLVQQKLVA